MTKPTQQQDGKLNPEIIRFILRNGVNLPDVRFDAERASPARMAELARMFYSTSNSKEKKDIEKKEVESISEILPRVIVKIAKLYQQRTN